MLDALYLGGGVLAALCLAAIGLLILVQIAARWFGVIVPAAEEIAGWLMAATTFLALAYTHRAGGHIRVNLVIRSLHPKARRWQEALVIAIALAFAVALAHAAFALVHESWRYGDLASGHLAVPLWIPQLPMALGIALLALALADDLVTTLAGRQPGYRQTEDLPAGVNAE